MQQNRTINTQSKSPFLDNSPYARILSGAADTFFDFTAFRSECVSAAQSKEC